jgi:spore coat protein U-like protein
MNQRSLLAAAVAASLLVTFGNAQAASPATTTFTVSATLANNCSVSAANVGFGTINAGIAATNTANSITLTCNKGTIVSSVALNNGANASGTLKRMINGTEFLNYQIDVPTGATFNTCPAAGAGPEWNASNTIVATSLFATTGGPKSINICASIPAGQFPSAGTYSDTVSVSATFN